MARDSLTVQYWSEEDEDIVRIAVNGTEGFMDFDSCYLLESLIRLEEEIKIGPKIIVEWEE